jgi:hypothetical protein
MNATQIHQVGQLGRRLALTVGVDPDDGQQEALLLAVIIEGERASKAKPLTIKALLGRVHDRLIGATSGRRGPHHGTLDTNQGLFWRGQCVGLPASLGEPWEQHPAPCEDCAAAPPRSVACNEERGYAVAL